MHSYITPKQPHSREQRNQMERQLHRYIFSVFAILVGWILLPEVAMAQDLQMQFPIIDKVFCGFIAYSKSKLAPYIAVLVIILGVIGHWLGATKVWGTILYVVIGLGVISMVGSIVVQASGAGASCLSAT